MKILGAMFCVVGALMAIQLCYVFVMAPAFHLPEVSGGETATAVVLFRVFLGVAFAFGQFGTVEQFPFSALTRDTLVLLALVAMNVWVFPLM